MERLRRQLNYLLYPAGIPSNLQNNQFVHDFVQNILHHPMEPSVRSPIEKYRVEVYRNKTLLDTPDPGAGTRSRCKKRSIGDMARVASVSPKYGRLLYNLARFYWPDRIIELGTGVGISTLYLAAGNPEARVITVEGNPQLAAVASGNFTARGLKNITLIQNSFDHALPQLTSNGHTISLFFIDGNHTLEATLRYYHLLGKNTGLANIFVLDDLNWSRQMSESWKIIHRESSGIIIDLFHMGIIFHRYGDIQQKLRFRY
jgi:predicted O-methyltransferase YrrM